MIVSIAQPCYLPWMGYFDRIRQSDLHIVLDHVQFEKGSFTNRCLIRQRDGRTMWLTVPVEKGKPIRETRIVGTRWMWKHGQALWQAYPKMRPTTEALFSVMREPCRSLQAWCWLSQDYLRKSLPPLPHAIPFEYSSKLGGDKLGHKSELVLNLCKEVGASTYLSGPHGRDYLDLPSFERAGIEVAWHDFPVKQPVLSAVHDLFA